MTQKRNSRSSVVSVMEDENLDLLDFDADKEDDSVDYIETDLGTDNIEDIIETSKLNGVKKMIEEDRYCDDILIQLSAVNKAIKAVANNLLDNHMHTCLIENIQSGKMEIIDEIVDLFKRFQ